MIRRLQLSRSKFRLTLFSFHRGGDSSNSYSYPYTCFTFATPEQRFELQWFWWEPPPFCLCMRVCLAPFISLTPISPRHPCNMHVLVLLIFDKGLSVILSLVAFLDIVFVCVYGEGEGDEVIHPSTSPYGWWRVGGVACWTKHYGWSHYRRHYCMLLHSHLLMQRL